MGTPIFGLIQNDNFRDNCFTCCFPIFCEFDRRGNDAYPARMDMLVKLLGLWPLAVVVLLAVVLIRAGRSPKPHGDNPPESTGGSDP